MAKKIDVLRQHHADLSQEVGDKAAQALALEAKESLSDDDQTELDAIDARLTELETLLPEAKAAVEKEDRRLKLIESAAAATLPAQPINRDDPDPNRFASFGEQLMAVVGASMPGGSADPRLFAAASGASEAVGADGGFLVQQEFASELIADAHETGLLPLRCRSIPAGANFNSIKIPAVDETSRADGSRWGGVRAYWDGEAEQFTKSKPKFSFVDLKLAKLTGLFYATDELLEDATALGAVARQAFGEEFGFKMDDAIFRGTGVGMPEGFLNAPATVSQAKESGQAAATINEKNVLNMWSRMPASLRAGAVWLINQDAEPQLPQMSIANQPVYLPPGRLSTEGFSALLGRPVIALEQCETLGTVGDFCLVNLKQYLLYEKGPMETAMSIHVRFEFGEQVFRFVMRQDGKPRWKSALTPFKGSNTVSPFITLATRA